VPSESNIYKRNKSSGNRSDAVNRLSLRMGIPEATTKAESETDNHHQKRETYLEFPPFPNSTYVERERANDLPAHDTQQDPEDLRKDRSLAHDSRGVRPIDHDEERER
jgi:hypothetical protein